MNTNPAVSHMHRAQRLITEAGRQFDKLREVAVKRQASSGQEGGFLSVIATNMKLDRQLKNDISALKADIDLALAELDKAEAADPEAIIEVDDTLLRVNSLRAGALFNHGVIEASMGNSQQAKQFFYQSIKLFDMGETNYWMAHLYENDGDAKNALIYYERCLAIDPDGELSVDALRSANRMRTYKKQFRGNWGLFGCLLLLFFPAAIIYYIVNKR